MRSFLTQLGVFVLLQALLLAAVLWFGCRQPNSFLHAANLKHQRLADAEGKRLILVGGSNIVQGVNSDQLEELLPDYRPTSMSLTMVLGLPFMLDEVRYAIREGDVVMILPEYQLFSAGKQVSAANAAFIAEMIMSRPAALDCVTPAVLRAFLDQGGLSLLGQVLRGFTLENVKRSLPPKRTPVAKRYGGAFNEDGDAIWHRDLAPVPFPAFRMRPVDPEKLRETIVLLNEFHDFCRGRGAKVCLHYPPLPQPEPAVREVLADIDRQLRGGLNFPVLNPPEASFYGVDQFHDTCYHLAWKAIPSRTAQLAEALRPLLEAESR